MSEGDIFAFVTSLAGVAAMVASEASGAPEAAWGDSFFFYDPDDEPANRRMPFATIVTKDYDGFDTASDLNRPGVFRLNIAAGRTAYQDLVGHAPAQHPEHHAEFDYAALDRILPNPVYAAYGWVSILNPGEATSARARSLLTAAHARDADRRQRRARRASN